MFVTRKDHWFHLLFAWRGTVLIKIWRRYLFVVSLATLITVLFHFDVVIHFGLSDKPFSLIGLALGIFLGFRNNTSYDRFWEGRKLWGGVVNTSRSICRKIDTMIFEVDSAQKHELIRLVACYPHLLAQHLRKESDFSVIQHLCKDTSFLEKEKKRTCRFLTYAWFAIPKNYTKIKKCTHFITPVWKRNCRLLQTYKEAVNVLRQPPFLFPIMFSCTGLLAFIA